MHKMYVYLSYAALHKIKVSLMLTTSREGKERKRERDKEITSPGSQLDQPTGSVQCEESPHGAQMCPYLLAPVPGLLEPSLTPAPGVVETPISQIKRSDARPLPMTFLAHCLGLQYRHFGPVPYKMASTSEWDTNHLTVASVSSCKVSV